jgi:hypothetical protein
MTELKPCPMCNGEAVHVYHNLENLWGVECNACLLKLHYVALSKVDATTDWNSRPPRPAPTDADVQRVADTELLHRVAEAMKERAAITATCNGCGTRSFEQIIADEIRAIDTAALVKEVCGHD